MKKIALFSALLTLTFATFAQNLNVQSAMSDLKRGYLNKAKAAIDKACVHEDTKDDAKTWYYAGLIYSQIGGEAAKPKSKYKDLDPDWCQKAYNAALRCKELDKENEYARENTNIFRFVGNTFYNQAVAVFNEGDYAQARQLSEEAIKVFNNSGDADFSNESYYLAGRSCVALKDTTGIIKYYGQLVRKGKIKPDFAPKMPTVYNTMFSIYKASNDTANVLRVAERYTKTLPADPNGKLLLADAYIWTGNNEKGIELANQAVESVKEDPALYPMILCAAAGIFEHAGDYAGAEAKYRESATLQPEQVAANYGMGVMLYNRAADKIKAIDDAWLSPDPDEALINKLNEEYRSFFQQAIPYFQKAIAYIDGIQDPQQQAMNRPNLYNCLLALSNCYARLEMLDESKAIKARLDTFK